jgi:cysteine-rich repeat protein
VTKQVFVCGDGVQDAVEQCDDGNLNAGDGCGPNCKLEQLPESEPNDVCGTEDGPFNVPSLLAGQIKPVADKDFFSFTLTAVADVRIDTYDSSGPATCNGGIDTIIELRAQNCTTILASDDDDGVNNCSSINSTVGTDTGARHLLPGTYFVYVHEYGDNNEIPNYTVHITLNALCGDGVKEGSEECDDVSLPTATCDANCDRIATCGDGFVDPPEQCEDGNVVSGDGCSDMCFVEDLVLEQEPNGTSAEADLSSVQISGDAHVKGNINPIADKDIFKLTLAQDSTVRIETFDPSLVDCTTGMTTTVRVLNSAATEIYADSVSGIASCSALVVNLAAGTYYVQVEETGNNAVIPSYMLEIDIQTDGGSEVEPNNTQMTSNDLTAQTTDFVVLGDHQMGTDTDYYAITVPNGWSLRIEAAEGNAETCESNEVDTYFTLYNAAGTQLDIDDDTGRGYCSLIDGTGTAPLDPPAHALAGGIYYLKVTAATVNQGNSKGVFNYRLAVTVRAP